MLASTPSELDSFDDRYDGSMHACKSENLIKNYRAHDSTQATGFTEIPASVQITASTTSRASEPTEKGPKFLKPSDSDFLEM